MRLVKGANDWVADVEMQDRSPRTRVRYEHYSSAWRFGEYLTALILESGAKTICEIGSGGNPVLNLPFVRSNSIDYVLVDVSEAELAKADDGYSKIVADITDQHFVSRDRYDLVFSKMLAEHVRDPEAFHRNVFSLLSKNGVAIHFFPTLYAVPFVVNRFLPEPVSDWIVRHVWPERTKEGGYPKFPARYAWCYGPTPKQLERFTRLGYDVEEYVGFFGHGYYDRMRPLRAVTERLTKYLLAHPSPYYTSYAYVVLRRPG